MTGSTIDLASWKLWLCVLGGTGALVPIVSERARTFVLAIVNLAAIAFLLGPVVALWVVAGVLCAWLVLQALAKTALRRMTLVGITLSVLALFVMHKSHLPSLAAAWPGLTQTQSVLAVVGFSYIALRTVEVARSVFEGRAAPPALHLLTNYLVPFHMLAAGPVQEYTVFHKMPVVTATLSISDALGALDRIATGLFKKFVLAQAIATYGLHDFGSTGFMLFVEIQWFYLWLYLDFSAYTDLAVGIGRLLGVPTPENFDRPLLARNIMEFWQRWHMSFSFWVRRNIFTPLQLWTMRATRRRWPLGVVNMAYLVAFTFVGLWHAFQWPWIAWGLLNALGLVACNTYRHVLVKRLGAPGLQAYMENATIKLLARAVTFEYVALSLAVAFYPWKA